MDDDHNFDYERSVRYFERSLRKSCESVKALLAKPNTGENITELRVNLDYLVDEYTKFKRCTEKGFKLLDPKRTPEDLKASEDTILNNLDVMNKCVLPYIAKAKSSIAAFEGEKVRENLNTSSLNSSLTGNEPNVKLPRINVPKFDGELENFLEFSALFQNVIHDEPTLSKVRKLYYLKECLVGKAEYLLKDIPLTERGYDEAWGLVQSTYKDIKSITRKHFDSLFSVPRIKYSSEVPNLLSTVNRSLKGLKACGEEPDSWSSIIAYIVSEKLDERTYTDFEKTLTSNQKFPSWKTLRAFLETRASVTKRKVEPKPLNRTDSASRSVAKPSASVFNLSKTPSKPKCVNCGQYHLLIECEDFRSKSPRERFEAIKSKSFCRNCFKTNHKTTECLKPPNCRKCKAPHHTMLHFDEEKPTSDSSESKNSSNKESTPPETSSASPCVYNTTTVTRDVRKPIALLPTAVVKFKSGKIFGEMRILLDSCSQLNLISSSFINRFNLSTVKDCRQRVSGVTGITTECNRIINLIIQSRTESFCIKPSFNVIATKLPYSVRNSLSRDVTRELQKYKLADPAYYEPNFSINEIDALLGVEAYNLCVRGNVIRFDNVCLRDTTFGWTLSSVNSSDCERINRHTIENAYCGLTIEKIDERLQKFWQVEDVKAPSLQSTDADTCVKHFEKTYSRADNGQFIVRLPFKGDPMQVTNNYQRALAYAKRIEQRLDEPTKVLYTEFMSEYKALNHMSLITGPIDPSNRYFIPHHAVIKPSSTTTKLRVVFHASSKSNSNLSLNEVLLVGPVLQPELFDILLKFRTFVYAFTGDIEKMYRCVLIHEDDRRYQSIIWNGACYELNTVTYGTAPASFLVTKCLQRLADENESISPTAAEAIRSHFYMDDLLSGSYNLHDAIELRTSIHRILKTAGFNLRKYQSNSHEILNLIEPELIEHKLSIDFGKNESLAVLGLQWSPSADTFSIKSESDEKSNQAVTKRHVLSAIARTFDPLGLAAPVVIRGKLLLQKLWKRGLQWDSPLPTDLDTEFKIYLGDITTLNRYARPRYVGHEGNTKIVGFCDASEQAYCAAIYVIRDDKTSITAELYCAKSRVAPVKALTIPQLELQAAVLLTELTERARLSLNAPSQGIRLFTDSTIVLAWLSRPANDWKVFVRNRVAKISSTYPVTQWRHVRSKENPADLATRGLSTKALIDSKLWAHGPDFLTNESMSGTPCTIDDEVDYKPYLAKPKVAVFISTNDIGDASIIESFSSYSALIRLYATTKAICRKWKRQSSEKSPVAVSVSDIVFAEKYLVRVIQRMSFADEIQRLSSNRKISKRSRLRRLTPYIDEVGILRSQSRLRNANIPFNQKYPIILPSRCHFTTLLIRHLHERFFHATRSFLIAHLSVKFIFVGSISYAIKRLLNECVTCRRYFHQSKPQQMSDLPANRVRPRPPFEVVGIDFTGAFSIKCNHHRTTKYAKAYAAIFVCFVSRAVHIELVPSLSTEAFLNALKCFTSRRGVPATIYSDNGTNFHGTENYLNADKISKFAEQNRIEWRFNPPYTPHRGGIWEAAVKSAKRFIPLVTKDQTMTEFELRTLLTQIEGLLNSRPLCYNQTSDSLEEILTPGHFVTGRNLTTLPEPETATPATIKISAQYRANRQRIRDFWNLWSRDYLNQLRHRNKWCEKQPNLSEGQIVLFKEHSTPPSEWPLARVNRCLPDSKGVVRTIEIRFHNKLKIVPSVHVIPLISVPVNN